MATLREQLARPGSFVVATEIVTSRGLVTANGGGGVLDLARELADDPRIDVLSITDNPGGNAMFSPDALGTDMISRGQEVIIHLACKDWNRNALESRGWQLGSVGFHNVLALSGDYPIMGHKGLAAPVFDIDSVGLLGLLAEMNEGLPDARKPDVRLDRTDFFLGCVVTNHKRHEREVMPQYFKLRKKAHAGARFVINQIGWDVRKDDELLRWIRRRRRSTSTRWRTSTCSRARRRARSTRGRSPASSSPTACSSWPSATARARTRAGRSSSTSRRSTSRSPAASASTASYLGGHTPAATFGEIVDLAGCFAPDDWRSFVPELRYPFDDEFYLFEPDPDTGLSSDTRERRVPRVEAAAAHRPARPVHVPREPPHARRRLRARGAAPPHRTGASTAALEKGPRVARRAAHAVEQAAKVALFGCLDCGDCSLPEIAYVCPESQCAKNQRNGPCGGTREGLCEVYDSECIWSQAYERLKAYGEEESMLDGPVVVKDNALAGTSAWANAFLGRDHVGTEGAA